MMKLAITFKKMSVVCTMLCLFTLHGVSSTLDSTQLSQAEDKYYEAAYAEMADMLDGKVPLSIKRSIFLAEWAYLNGTLDYDDYCLQIDTIANAIKQFIAANNLEQFKTGRNVALFEYFSRPYSMNGYKHFTYDYEDFGGTEDLTKLFVTKVMRTHSGQCHSLPLYYKVLAEAVGAEAHITFAPQHLFIRHRDEQDPNKWVNVELTTQSLSREIFYIENFGITDDAIRNKIYLYPLSDRETVAFLLSWLTQGYYRKYQKWDGFVLRCADKVLEHYPQDITARMAKCNVMNSRIQSYVEQNGYQIDEHVRQLDLQWQESNKQLEQLGWADMSDNTYKGLLRGVEEQMQKDGVDSLTIKAELEKAKQTDRKNINQ